MHQLQPMHLTKVDQLAWKPLEECSKHKSNSMKKRKPINSKKMPIKVKKGNSQSDNKKLELEKIGPSYVDMFETCDLKLTSERF
jgi:hypothetical protein